MSGYEAYFPLKIPKLMSIPNMGLVVFLISAAAVVYLLAVVYINCRAESRPGSLTVIKRLGRTICTPDTTFTLPLIDTVEYLSVIPFSFEAKYSDIVNSEGVKFEMMVKVSAEISKEGGAARRLAEEFGSTERVAYFIEDTLKSMLSIAMLNQDMTVSALSLDASPLEGRLHPLIAGEMIGRGIEIRGLKITELRDVDGSSRQIRRRRRP